MKSFLLYLPSMFFLFSSILKANEKDPLYVGFLEKDGVRKAFEYKESRWQSSLMNLRDSKDLSKIASQYAAPSEWTLFFNGKTYGKLFTKPFNTYASYKENGLQKIKSEVPKLIFRKTDKKFSDWNGDSIRPVLVSNSKSMTDPNQWKRGSPKKIHPFILKDFKARLKDKVYFCKNENCEGTPETRDIKDKEISLASGYQDKDGNELHAVVLNFSPKAYAYCEIEGDNCQGNGPFWYLLIRSKEPRFLTSAAALIDAADLNHDGSSEFLFWVDEYNSNGYELIDGKTHISERATWSYH